MSSDRHLRSRFQRRHLRIAPLAWAMAVALAPAAVVALPEAGVVKQGQATIQNPQTGQMQIRQTTQNATIDWRSFSVDKGETVQIFQPNAQSLLINRVIGYDPSRILGQINANGRVVLSNPRGVYFAAGSQVDVGSLVATTLSISDADLQSGRLRLGSTTGGAGELRAEGSIRAADAVVLAAPQLEVSGQIDARRVGLAAASHVTVDVEGDGLVLFNVRNDDGLDTKLNQLGRINATQSAELRAAARAGFADTVLNMEGVVRARSLDGVAGRVVVDGGAQGITWVKGTVDASGGDTQTGGDVLVQGQRIMLDAGAQLDASGGTGGGRIRVGGDFHGANPEVRNAEMLIVRPGARLNADAVTQGDGGKVVLWSEQNTTYLGSLSARGGMQGGNGGQAEVSGRQGLTFDGASDLSAARGRVGQLLLDPDTIDINNTGGAVISGNISFTDAPPANPVIKASGANSLEALLATQNVVLQAKSTITVTDGVNDTSHSLTLQAGGDITINSAVTTGGLNLSANDPSGTQTGSGKVITTANISAASGTLTINNNGGSGVHLIGGSLTGNTLAVTGNLATTGAVQISTTGTSTVASNIGLGGNLTVAGSGALTLSGNISGAGSGLVKVGGSGTLTLSGTNTYDGGTSINAGTLNVSGGAALLDSGAVTLANVSSATFTVNGNETIGALSGGGTTGGDITLGSGRTLTVGGGNATSQYDGAMSGAGSLAKTGSGTLTLTNTNTYTGGTSIAAGTLQVGDGNTTGQITYGGVSGSGILAVNRSDNINIGGNIGGNVTFNKLGSNTLTLSGTNTYTGGTNIIAGTLRTAGGAALPNTGTVTLSNVAGATLNVSADETIAGLSGGGTTGGEVVVNNNQTLTVGSGNVSSQFDGVISGSGALTKTGTGTLTLTGNNTYSDFTTINGGTLQIGNAGTSGAIDYGNATGSGTLAINRSDNITISGALSGSLKLSKLGNNTVTLTANNTHSGGTDIAAGTLQLGNGGAAGLVTLSGVTGSGTLAINRSDNINVISSIGSNLSFSKLGSNIVTLSGTNTYTGITTVASGTLVLPASTALPSTAAVTLANTAGATLDVTGDVTIGSLSGGGTTGGTVALAGTKTLTVGSSNNASSQFDGVISGSGALTKAGTGTLTLTGTNSYSGSTTISNGTLQIGNAGTTGSINYANVAGSGTLALNRSDNFTIAANLGGGISLSKLGNNVVTLTGTNTYSGGTNINNGTLRAAGTAALPTTGTVTVADAVGATLDVTADVTIGALNGGGTTGGAVTVAATKSLTVGNGNASAQFDGVISGAGGVTKTGSGTLTLTGTNTYSGSTTVSSGTLQLGAGGNTGSLQDLGTVTGSGTLAFNRADDLTIADNLGNNLRLSKLGSNILTLAGTNSYTGGTSIAEGTLRVTGGTALPNTGTVTLANTAGVTLDIAGSETIGGLAGGGAAGGNVTVNNSQTLTVGSGNASSQFDGVISGGGALAKTGTGTLTLTGANTYGGGTTIGSGTLQMGNGGATGVIPLGNVSGSGTLAINRSDALTITDVLGGLLNLSKLGSNTVTLTADNTYTGTTTIAAGTLQLGNGGTAGNLGLTTLTGAGTLSVNRSNDVTISASLGGGLSLSKLGTNTVTLLADNTHSGGTAIASGTLQLGNGGTSGSVPLNAVTGSGTLAFARSDDFTVSSNLGSNISLTKLGSNTITLSGTNTYSGTTTVSAGTLAVSGGAALPDAGVVQLANTAGTTLSILASETLGALNDGGATGGNVVLGTGQTLTVSAGSFNGAISGNGSITKTGAGTLSLAGSNSYTGGTAINGGTLSIAGGAALADTGSVTLANAAGATLNVTASETIGSLIGGGGTGGNITLATGQTLTVGADNASSQFGGVASGAGALAKTGTGTLTVTGTNTHTGGTTIDNGTLQLGNGGTTGVINLGGVSGTGTLAINRSDDLDIGANLGGGLRLNKLGSNTVTLSGTNTYTGGTVISSGALQLGNGGLTGSVDLDGVSGSGTLAFNRSDNLTVANNLGSNLSINKLGSNIVTLAGNNTYSGTTTVSAGTLAVSGGAALPNSGTVTLANTTGTALVITTSEAIGTLNGGGASGGTVDIGSGQTLTVSNGAFGGTISGAGGALAKVGAGTLALSGTNTYTGGTTINAGTLSITGGAALADAGSVTLADTVGAVLNVVSSETIAALNGGGTSGGNVVLGSGQTLTVGGGTYAGNISGVTGSIAKIGAGTLVLSGTNTYGGATSLAAGQLTLGADGALGNGTLAITGGTLDIGSHNSTVAVFSVQNGTIDGTTGVLTAPTYTLDAGSTVNAKLGTGTINTNGAVAINGTAAATFVNVNTGALALGNADRLADDATVNVANGATLKLNGNETIGSLTLAGLLDKTGAADTLTASSGAYNLNSGAVVNALLGTGTLTSNGNVTLNGTSAAGTVNVASGMLTLGGADRLADGAAVTVANSTVLKLNGNDTVGSLSLNGTLDRTAVGDTLSAANYQLHNGAIVNAALGAGTVSSDGTTVAVNAPMAANTVNVVSGRLTLGAANLLADTATVSVSAPGVLKLGGDDAIGQLTLAGQLEANASAMLTASGGYTLNNGITRANANLGAGSLTATGTSTLEGTSAAGAITVGTGSTLILATPDNRLTGGPSIFVNDNGTLTLQGNNAAASINLGSGAQVNGAGTLSAASYVLDNATFNGNLTGGELISRRASVLNGQSAATTVKVETGSLTLGSGDRFTSLPNVVISTGASLALGGQERFGSLAGGGDLALGSHTLQTGSTQSTVFSGVISGGAAACLQKEGVATTFTLSGASTHAGLTQVQQGTLLLAGINRLGTTSNLQVDSGAVLQLNGNQTVANLSAAGQLDRTGAADTLTATTTTLNSGARVSLNLAGDTLTSEGAVTLNGTASNNMLTVASGTLSLGGADRLGDSTAVDIASGATLLLNGSDTIGTLTSAGILARTSTTDLLTAGSYLLNSGATVNADLGAGVLTSQGTVALNGTSAASTVTVVSGVLTLGAANRLADTAAVSIANGATLQLNGNDTVGSITSAGNLASAAPADLLTAATYTLNNGAVINANLGAGTLTSSGNVTLNGTAAASAVNVGASSLLSLGAADRLADNAAVNLASGATLQLNGNDTIASLTTAGTLSRTGAADTLTAATVNATNGARLVAHLGAGNLTTSGSVLLSGNAAVQALTVSNGSLQLDGSNQLTAAPVTTLAAGSSLQLAGDQTLGSLTGAGAIVANGGTLSVGSRSGSQYDGVISGAGQLRKEGSGTLVLTGNNNYSGPTTIAAGTLQLGANTASGSVGSGSITNAGLLRVDRSDSLTLASAISGSGGVEQSGSGTLVLTGNNTYAGTTTIAAGTLQVGAGGSQGTLGSGAVSNAGLLRWQRSDAVTLNQTVTGTGGVEQAGTGSLTLASALQTTGITKVSRGSLVTGGDERIANGSSVSVDAGANLKLGGNETLAGLTSAGNVELAGNLTSAGDVKITGALALTGTGPQTLAVNRLEALNASNALGAQPLSLNAQAVQLNAGDTAALKLGTVALAADSSISAGTVTLTGDVTLTGGTTTLTALAAPAQYTPEVGKQAANGQFVSIADATISQYSTGLLRATGGALALQAKGGGSILLREGAANDLSGGISAISGTAGAAWNANGAGNIAEQSRIRLSGDTLRVSGAGVEGDLIAIDAAKLTTAAGSAIRARLPYSPQLGFAVQLPGLTLTLRDTAFTQSLSFGAPGDGNAIAVDVGSSAITAPAGFITVLPKKPAALGATAVYANGPQTGTNGYQLFYDGASRSTEVPVIYNGAAPATPEAQGSISATVAVSEGARKDRFEEAVRTENVAIRLRAGVIAEVGAGRPATIGKEGAKPPETCTPTALLGCEP